MTRVGFVGLGSQGGPMARRIADAGFPTMLWARRPASLEPFADSAALTAGSLAELAAWSDVLGVCVVDDAGVDALLRGPAGALASMRDGCVVVVHSTVHPETCVRLQADHPRLHIVDAPVSGGGQKAAAGELVVMVGGEAEIVERCRPILQTFGDPVLHLGSLGAGQATKVLNNTVFTAHLALAAEVFELAIARGLDPAAVSAVLLGGSGRSYGAEVVSRAGYDLARMAATAGGLLAKDVGILADHFALRDSGLLRAADDALARMGLARAGKEHQHDD
jgi:3-hydroxyisobutyrate dehydrogenase-like beta-hydroxyacid dehydrogenase